MGGEGEGMGVGKGEGDGDGGGKGVGLGDGVGLGLTGGLGDGLEMGKGESGGSLTKLPENLKEMMIRIKIIGRKIHFNHKACFFLSMSRLFFQSFQLLVDLIHFLTEIILNFS